jgi:5-methylcytosine-specific restriction protein A
VSKVRRGYDRRWEKIRAAVLAEQPLCFSCEEQGWIAEATEVDHVIPLSRGGTHDRNNLRPMCRSCHSRKTAREDGGFGRGRGTSNL